MRQSLTEFKPHILHLTGHGFFELDEQGQPVAGLVLEDKDGNILKVSASELGEILQGRAYLRMVVLSACRTALPDLAHQTETEKAITSTAAELGRRAIPVVIAIQESVRDATAIRFAQCFYPALLSGQAPGAALATARNNLTGSDWTENQQFASDWGMPVLLTSRPELNPFTFSLPDRSPRPKVVKQGTDIAPLQETNYFVGRQAQQRDLRRVLTESQEKLAIITGLGGMGKSTLTQRAVERFGWRYGMVQFISVKDWQGLDGAMRILAKGLADSGFGALQGTLEQPRLFSPAEYGTLAGKALAAARAVLVLDNFEDLLD